MTAHPLLLRAARLPQQQLMPVGLLMPVELLVPLVDVRCWPGWEVAPGEPLRQVGWAVRVAPAAVSRSHRPDLNRPPQPVPSPRAQLAAALAVALYLAPALPRPMRVLVRSLEIRRGARYGSRVRTPPGI